jgi:hypothetical protein
LKKHKNLVRVGLSQDLQDANWLLVSSPIFRHKNPNSSPYLCHCFIVKTFRVCFTCVLWVGTNKFRTHMTEVLSFIYYLTFTSRVLRHVLISKPFLESSEVSIVDRNCGMRGSAPIGSSWIGWAASWCENPI